MKKLSRRGLFKKVGEAAVAAPAVGAVLATPMDPPAVEPPVKVERWETIGGFSTALDSIEVLPIDAEWQKKYLNEALKQNE